MTDIMWVRREKEAFNSLLFGIREFREKLALKLNRCPGQSVFRTPELQ